MANMLFANNCNTTLASSLTSGATSMSVTSATGFPSPTGVQYFYCTLADAATQTTIEIVKVTSVTGTTFAITRGQDGTTGTAFAAGAVVSLRLVRASLNDFPKLSETNTFNADQSIVGALTTSAGLVSTNTFTATPPSDGLVMDYATGFGRFSAFAGDGFQWYNAGVANTKLMQLSSTGVITTATWNGATVTVPYGGTGLTSLTAGYIPYGNGTSAFNSSSNLYFDGTNLGIGTSSPSALLEVKSTAPGVVVNGTSTTAFRGFSIRTNGTEIASMFAEPNNGENRITAGFSGFGGYQTMYTNGSERMRIFTSGGVSIGNTTDPGAGSLNVNSKILVNRAALYDAERFSVNQSTAGQVAFLAQSYATSNQTNLRLYHAYATGGNTGTQIEFLNAGGTTVGSVTSTTSATAYVTSSDYRLKENIQPMTGGLDIVEKLNPVTYDWISTKIKSQGFIAHELQKLVPDCVVGEKDAVDEHNQPIYQGIDTSFLVATLTCAIKELKQQFDAYVASHP